MIEAHAGADVNDDLIYLSLSGLLGLLISIAAVILELAVIALVYHPSTDISGASGIFIVPSDTFFPEPVERAQYIAGMLTFPIALYASTALLFRRLSGSVNVRPVRLTYNVLLAAFLALALCLALATIRYVDDNVFLGKDFLFTHPLLAVAVLALIVSFVAARRKIERRLAPAARALKSIWLLLALAIVSMTELLPVMNRYTVGEEPLFTDHFNAVFHAVVQVYQGKALLVDLVHQYGLYPQMLEPVFQLTGLSVFRFTIVMTFLLGASMLAVYLFLNECLRSRTILFLGFSTFVFYSYIEARIAWGLEPFFQAQPIRTFFPLLSIYFVWRYAAGKRNWYYATFVLGALAILWNADTGFVVFLAWLLVLFYQELAAGDLRTAIKAIRTHIITALVALASILLIFTFYIYLRYGEFPAYGELFSYQKIFYMYGFSMLPMPLIRPWNIVILVYMIGLMIATKALVHRDVTARSKMLFYISVLGAGVFSYYQGRSHDSVLTAVWYPAILLLVMFADDLWAYTKVVRRDVLRSAMLVILLFVFTATLFNLMPNKNVVGLLKVAEGRALAAGPTQISSNADFIKDQANPGEQVLILSYNSGVYYLESKTTSPLRLPGPSEIILRKDFEAIDNYILSGNADKIIFDRDYINHNSDWLIRLNSRLYEDLLSQYDRAATGPNGNIIIFSRRAGD